MNKESFPAEPIPEITRLREEIRELQEKNARLESENRLIDVQKEALLDLHVQQDENVREEYQKRTEEHEKRMTDDLTGLYNREAFVKKFEDLTALQSDNEQRKRWIPVTFLALDLDGFKEVNDAYGHAGGNLVLQQAAAFLKGIGRDAQDIAYRFHGDEFAMLFFNVKPEELMERFRGREKGADGEKPAGEASLPFTPEVPSPKDPSIRIPVDVTFSAGLVEVLPGSTLAETLKRGDDALYTAKRAGKNRIYLAPRNTVEED